MNSEEREKENQLRNEAQGKKARKGRRPREGNNLESNRQEIEEIVTYTYGWGVEAAENTTEESES